MAFYIRSVLSKERVVTAGEQVTYDLPVNPLSFITLRLTGVKAGAERIITYSDFWGLVSSFEILWRGSSIYSARLDDLAVVLSALGHKFPRIQNLGGASAQRVSYVQNIGFGRRKYWLRELLPPVSRGQLQLRLQYASSLGDFSSVLEHIETTEILDATPERFLKITSLPKTPTATGEHDVDLPIGNPIIGILLFGTTAPSGSSATASIEELKLLVDNVEFFQSQTFWEEMHDTLLDRLEGQLPELIQRGTFSYNAGGPDNSIAAGTTEANTVTIPGLAVGDVIHVHPRELEDGLLVESWAITAADTLTIRVRNTTAASITTAAQTWEFEWLPLSGPGYVRNYAYLDYDPLVDPDLGYALLTAGRSRVNLRIVAGVADPIRVLPVEVISIAPRGT